MSFLSEMPARVGRKKRAIGRGTGSGRGKTAGKGHKGAKARAGSTIGRSYEGGQTPISRRMPKKGFRSLRKPFYELSLSTVNSWLEFEVVKENDCICKTYLEEKGLIKGRWAGVRLLGQDALIKPISFSISGASQAARSAVERSAGTVVLVCKERFSCPAL